MLRGLRESARRALPPPSAPGRRAGWGLWAILGVGAVLRLVWVQQVQAPRELRDPGLYLILAENLAAGDGYSYGPGPDQGTTAYYPPGYPAVLGAAVWLARLLPGHIAAFDVAVALNVALSVATIGLVFALGRRLAGRRTGLVAAGIWAVWPNLVFHTGVVLTETLFLFVLVLMLLVLLADPASARAPGVARLVAVGALFGIAVLVRPVSLVAAPVLAVLWWGTGARAVLWRLAVVGAATVAVILPWSIRSTMAMDEPVALSLNFGDNMCIGHNPDADGGFGMLEPHCFTAEGMRRPEAETERNAENIDRSLRYIRSHPGRTVALTDDRLRYTLADDHDGLTAASDWGVHPVLSPGTDDALSFVADAVYYLVGVLALAGAVLVVRRHDAGRRGTFLVLVGLAQLVSPLVTFGEPRFKMPLYPTMAVGAAVVVATVLDRRSAARADRDAAPGRPAVPAAPVSATAPSA